MIATAPTTAIPTTIIVDMEEDEEEEDFSPPMTGAPLVLVAVVGDADENADMVVGGRVVAIAGAVGGTVAVITAGTNISAHLPNVLPLLLLLFEHIATLVPLLLLFVASVATVVAPNNSEQSPQLPLQPSSPHGCCDSAAHCGTQPAISGVE